MVFFLPTHFLAMFRGGLKWLIRASSISVSNAVSLISTHATRTSAEVLSFFINAWVSQRPCRLIDFPTYKTSLVCEITRYTAGISGNVRRCSKGSDGSSNGLTVRTSKFIKLSGFAKRYESLLDAKPDYFRYRDLPLLSFLLKYFKLARVESDSENLFSVTACHRLHLYSNIRDVKCILSNFNKNTQQLTGSGDGLVHGSTNKTFMNISRLAPRWAAIVAALRFLVGNRAVMMLHTLGLVRGAA